MKTFSYTTKGQLEGMLLSVGNDSFAMGAAYDDVGRLKTKRYPQPLGQAPFEVTHDRDAHGFVVAVRDAATQNAYWELNEIDTAGRYAKETFGNGVTTTRSYDKDKQALQSITTMLGGSTIQQLSYGWDERLNLQSRTDMRQQQNKTERFRYDELDRVTCAYFGAVEDPFAPCVTSYAYGPSGNIVNKSDVGTYTYLDPKHPHAVTNAGSGTYTHDAVGNQITRPGGISITYTPFDLPKTIAQAGKTTTFGYDGDEQRIRKTTPNSETLYVGDLFEQVTTGTAKEFRYYVASPERVIAVVTRGGNAPGTHTLHTDHLGSVESVTNEKGEVVEKRSYDAYGARRNPQWGAFGGVVPGKTTRGFTGHEEDEEWGFVNARGRIYDPKLGRFLTTDPLIADVFDGQSFSAYGYVRNNPLALVDPSGFQAESPESDIYWDSELGTWGLVQYIHQDPPEPQEDDFVIPNHAANIGAYVPPVDVNTTGNGGGQTSSEGIGSFFEGLLMGGLANNDSVSATIGGIVGGLIPGVGLVADIRDLGAAIGHVASGKEGAWLELGASVIGFVPGGDIAKSVAKGITKGTTKGAAKVASEAVQEAAKVAKGSTVAAADTVSNAQKAVKGVQATPRGPPGSVMDSTNGAAGGQRAGKPHTQAAKRKAREAASENCPTCGVTMTRPVQRIKGGTVSPAEAQGDHIYPRSRGGDGATVEDLRNIRVTCASCNNKKSDRILP